MFVFVIFLKGQFSCFPVCFPGQQSFHENGFLLKETIFFKGELLAQLRRNAKLNLPRGYKNISCSTQLSIKFFLLINVEMPTIVGISTFMGRKK